MRLSFGVATLLVFLSACVPGSRTLVRPSTSAIATPTATWVPCDDHPFSARISASAARVQVGSTVTIHVDHDYSGDNMYTLFARDQNESQAQVLYSGGGGMDKNKRYQSKNFEPLTGGGYIDLNVVLRAIHPGKTTLYVQVNGEYMGFIRAHDSSCLRLMNFETAQTKELVLEAVQP